MLHLPVVRAVAVATLRNLVRRPAALVSALSLGALLALLPRLGNPAAGVRDNAALACELALSTLFGVSVVAAGLTSIHVLRAPGGGLEPEVRALPVGVGPVLWGRSIGAALAVLATVAGAGAVAVVGWLDAPATPAVAETWVPVLGFGLPAAALLAAALGAFLAVVVRGDLAVVAFLACVVLGRWGSATSPHAWWTWFVPDPTRGDVAREVAFGRPVGAAFLAACVVAALLHACALQWAAAVAISRRRSQDPT